MSSYFITYCLTIFSFVGCMYFLKLLKDRSAEARIEKVFWIAFSCYAITGTFHFIGAFLK